MISRSVVWGWLICLLARVGQPIQYAPLDPVAGDCALLLGRDRTSLYDYGTNLLRGSPLDFESTPPCITYDAVNQAYIEARKRIHVQVPPVERMWKTDEIAKVGELLLDITAQLAKTYGLSVEEIENGLPQIDTSKTLIQEVCPPYLSSVECHAGKYRRLDGLCNNINNPSWGATMTPFTRLVPPQFADGLNAPRASVLGHELPLPRVVSRTMHPDEGYHDHAGTVMVVAWGQFMDHDFTLTATPLDPVNKNDPEECCDRPPHQKHPYCLEIIVPDDDYFFKGYKVKCMDFVRSFPSVRPGCRLGSKVPYNTLTGVIDGNTVYGVDDEFGRHLRSGYGGELRMNPVFAEYGLKDLLPLKLDVPDEGCTRTNSSQFCFEAGEIRVNEQLVLTCMHTLMAREHNRVARGLAEINPHWDDETLYQEARRIVIAEIQHITFNEFLPIILGKDVMEKFGLMLQKEGYWNGYDPTVNPNIIAAFSAAAFRFGHSLLPTAVERWSKAHKFISSKRLSDLIRRPYDLYRAGVMDEYLMGLMNQVAQAMDDSITQEVTNHLLKKPGNRFGLDLVAFNMQRGREFGVPGYMQYRKFCGLPTADSFEELFGSMPNSTVHRYASIFAHPNDIDLWSGGVSERPLPGSMLGPTFACIIATQLSFIRRGDRFWYELPNQPSSFTPEQLQEIRKIKLSRVLCDNTDLIDTIQIYPMVLPDHQINPRVPCKAGIIPSLDLTKWAEFPNPAHYNTSKAPKVTTSSVDEIVVVCNGTAGCSVPGLDSLVDKTISNLDNLVADKQRSGSIVDIVAESPVLYIQRLKRWFQEQGLRRSLVKVPRSRKSGEYGSSVANVSVTPRQQSFERRRLIRRKRETLLQSPGENKMEGISFLNTPNNELKNQHGISQSDLNMDESQDYVKTKYRRRQPQYSRFKGPVSPSIQRRWEDDPGFNQQLLLGGSVRDYSTGNQDDPTNSFQILDADHDYEEYEHGKSEKEESDGSEEDGRDVGGSFEARLNNEEEKGGEESGEEVSRESSSEVRSRERERGSREREEEEDNGGENENTEEEEDVEKTKIVVLQPTLGNVQQNYPLGVPEDIQARYITKDPLAGPGATRGFNHDFKAGRAIPVRGGVTVLPNTRYPTVPGFSTKQIHSILTTGKLPGTIGVGPNGTSVGIIPIEPARNARPNNLGQYLEELHHPVASPMRGHARRPVGMRVRIKPQVYKGRPRMVYNVAPVRGHRVLYQNSPTRYRQPMRGGHLPYQGRGGPASTFRPREGGRPLVRVNIAERRVFEGKPGGYVGIQYENGRGGSENKPLVRVNIAEKRAFEENPGGYVGIEHESGGRGSENNPLVRVHIAEKRAFEENPGGYVGIQHESERRGSENKPLVRVNIAEKRAFEENPGGYVGIQHESGGRGSENNPLVRVHIAEKRAFEENPGGYVGIVHESGRVGSENKPQESYNVETENSKTLPIVKYDEFKRKKSKRVENDPPIKSSTKIYIKETPNEQYDDRDNSQNYFRVETQQKDLKDNNEEEKTDEENMQVENVKERDPEVAISGLEETEERAHSNDQDDLPQTLAKIMKRTKELENEKLTSDGVEPVSYNKYWMLEYSYPT